MPVQQKVLEQRHYKVAFRSSSDLCVSASVWIPAREPRLLISPGNNDPLSQHALRLHGANSWGTHFRTYSYSIPRRRVRARRIDAMSGIFTRFPCSAHPHMSLDSSLQGSFPSCDRARSHKSRNSSILTLATPNGAPEFFQSAKYDSASMRGAYSLVKNEALRFLPAVISN